MGNGTKPDDEKTAVYGDLSNSAVIAIIALSSPLYFYFDYQNQAFRGLVAAMSAGIILLLIWVLRPLVHRSAFWTSMVVVAAAHVLLVYFLPYTGEYRFGFAFFPLFFLDAYVSARLIIYACGARLRD